MQIPMWVPGQYRLPQTSRHLPDPGATQVFVKVTSSLGSTSTMALLYRQSFLGAVGSVVVTSVNLSGLTLSNLGAQNAGAVIAAITVTTSPPGGVQNTPVVLGGADAAKFSITNGGIIPCNLIAAVDIPAGSYSITLSAT